MYGGTKWGELCRSAEMFGDLCRNEHPYFALAFLYDLAYGRGEFKRMMDILESDLRRRRGKDTISHA